MYLKDIKFKQNKNQILLSVLFIHLNNILTRTD